MTSIEIGNFSLSNAHFMNITINDYQNERTSDEYVAPEVLLGDK